MGRVLGLGLRVYSLEFWVLGFGFGVWGFDLVVRVSGRAPKRLPQYDPSRTSLESPRVHKGSLPAQGTASGVQPGNLREYGFKPWGLL